MAVQTAVELSKRSNLKVYFLQAVVNHAGVSSSSVQVISLGMYDLLGNPSKIRCYEKKEFIIGKLENCWKIY